MKLELVTLSGVTYSGQVYEIGIPTAAGYISVYPDHMPLISLATPGVLTVRRTKETDYVDTYATYGGVVEVDGDTVRILMDEVEHADELVENEIRAAYEKAQQMKADAQSDIEIERAQALIDRQMVRLRVADLKRRPRRRS
ncbi:ATP synthase F1 subunit epsilon [Candidatus Saccharibacteria bacterium]|nr:MAG: ATP synthase F1 subunit epsilon [Candidatus Saccharibacteria bacterium]